MNTSAAKLRVAFSFVDSAVRTNSGWLAGFYYLRNCLNALASLPHREIPLVKVVVPESVREPLLLSHSRTPSWLELIEVEPSGSSAEALSALYQRLDIGVVFPLTSVSSVVPGCATIGWIPDFQHSHFPQFFTPRELETRELHYAFLAGWCDRVACSSSQVLNDFRATFPGIAEKAELLPFAVTLPDVAFDQEPWTTLDRFGLRDRRYVYLPNQFWLHKNHRTAYEAWRIVAQSAPGAVLVCSGAQYDYRQPEYYPELERYLADHELDGRVLRLGVLDRADQLQVMRGAACILQPSLSEGWSTSLEEAKALGKRVIASDIAVHREQCGPNAAYFPPRDAAQLARELLELLRHETDGYAPHLERAARKAYVADVQRFGRRLLAAMERAHADYEAHRPWSVSRELMFGFITDLHSRLTLVERDREARLEDVQQLTAQIAEIESDRAARLDAVESLTTRLAEAEADRAARLNDIDVLSARLAETEADRAARLDTINVLTARLAEAEADRAARLDAINVLTARLEQVEADRAARLEAVTALATRLEQVEADRAARLEAIDALTARLAEVEEDRAARLEAIDALTRRLSAAETLTS